MTITIDGPASSGKTSIATKIALEKNFTLLKSGSLYRAVSYICLRLKLDLKDHELIVSSLKAETLDLAGQAVLLNGKDISRELASPIIDKITPSISSIVPVRNIVNNKLRKFSSSENIIAEGRDMGTVVFPKAELKIYLDASLEVRAQRRNKEYKQSTSISTEILALEERDNIDKNKVEGALKLSRNTNYIDTTPLTFQDVYERILVLIERV